MRKVFSLDGVWSMIEKEREVAFEWAMGLKDENAKFSLWSSSRKDSPFSVNYDWVFYSLVWEEGGVSLT